MARRGAGPSEPADTTDTEVLDGLTPGADPESGTESGAEPGEAPTRRRGLPAMVGKKLVLVLAGVAVFSLLLGVGLMQFIVSPAELAARTAAPEAGMITVPIEERVIENTVTSRADVTYADAVQVTIETGSLSGPAVVTGQVPAVGAEFSAGSIALEVAGRPVIVLPGELPVYRSLSIGLSGPDVLQLKQALAGMGFDAGDPDSNVFDGQTAAAVAALYERAGYAPPAAGADAAGQLSAANDSVRSAQSAVAEAEAALGQANAGGSRSERIAADNAVREAERALQREQAGEKNGWTIASLQDALALAKVQRDEAYAPKDSGSAQAQVNSAYSQLQGAQEALVKAQEGAMATLPSGEVLFLSSLPRRVDDITVSRGTVLSGAAMTVSGAKLVVSGSVSATDAELLKAGQPATFDGPKGEELTATVLSVSQKKAGDAGSGSGGKKDAKKTRFEVLLEPQDLSPEQLEALRGTNVRVTIPVAATDGEVLAVPIAALSAGSGGESRVEIVTGDGDEGTTTVTVTAGLAAGGFVEISSSDPLLVPGAEVVVGR